MPYKRILVSGVLLYVIVILEFTLLTYYRLLYLPTTVAMLCEVNSPTYTFCVTEITMQLLYAWQWQVIKFSIYFVSTIILLWFMFKRALGIPLANLSVVGGIVAICLYASIKTGGADVIVVEPIACFLASIFTGLLVSYRRKRLVSFNVD